MNRRRYEDDVLAWTEEQAALLRAKETTDLDFANLAQEIESLGSSQKTELRSRVRILLNHLLKYRYQPDERSRSWASTIRVQRRDISQLLEDSPSLNRLVPAFVAKAYPSAREDALEETGLLRLPEECPFSADKTLDLHWLPD